MTRVLYLIKTLGRGGAERLLMDVALRLDSERFEAEIAYVSDEWDDLAADCRAAGLPVRYLGGRGRHTDWVVELRRLLREGEYDVVHVHSPYVASAARLLPRPAGVRFLYTEHAEWNTYRRPTRWANALTYWRNDQVFTVSDCVRESVRYPPALRFMPGCPVETLYHGIDFDAIHHSLPDEEFPRRSLEIPDDAPVVGVIAHFRPEKGHRPLLQAAARIHATLPDVRFVLIGGGPTEESVRDLVAALGLDDVVRFAGYRDDALHVATTFDVFALPSFREGLPIALIEAMALGKPAVATAVSGTPEVIRNAEHGILVPPGDAQAMADALSALLTDEERRARMGGAAQRRARAFDIRQAVGRLERAYER
jgi:glycosyltransferase involved in cell wall biosynthesis